MDAYRVAGIGCAAACAAVAVGACCRVCAGRRAPSVSGDAEESAEEEERDGEGVRVSRAPTPAPSRPPHVQPNVSGDPPWATWEGPRLGLEVTYDTKHMRMRPPVHRRAPFAVLFFDVVSEDIQNGRSIGAAVTVAVHDCCAEPSTLDDYIAKSLETLYEIEEDLAVEPSEPATLSGHPARQFCYNCVDSEGAPRRVFTIVTQLDHATFSISYSSPRASFRSLPMVKAFARRLRIYPRGPSDSYFTFTDPKYGVSLQLPTNGYHVASTAATGRSWKEVVQFTRPGRRRGAPAVICLDAEPADIPMLGTTGDASDRVPSPPPQAASKTKSSVSGLRYVAQLYRQQAIQDAAASEEVLWTRLDEDTARVPGIPAGALVPNERGRRDSHEVANSLTRSLCLRGGGSAHDIETIAFAYYTSNTSAAAPPACCIVYMWLAKGDLFTLSGRCDTDDRTDVARTMWRMANTVRYGEKHGQSSSLQYTSVQHAFALQLPSELTACEPFTGDPYVVYGAPAPADGGAAAEGSEFYVQVRVHDMHEGEAAGGGEALEDVLVGEMGELAAQDAVVHASKVTQLGGQPALEIVFTGQGAPYAGCAEVLALPPAGEATTLRMVTVARHMKITVECVAPPALFPRLGGVFAEMLESFVLKAGAGDGGPPMR